MQWARRNLEVIVPVGVVLVIGVAFLAFGVFGVQTLFIDDTVDESGPVFDSGVGVDEVSPPTTAPVEAPPANVVEAPEVTVADTPVETVPPGTEPTAPQVVTLAAGSFVPRGRYSGDGRALVLNDDSGAFDEEFIDLGNLKGNIGDQNYEIPPEVDLSRFDTVVVWCVRFSTPFTAADLVPTV